MAISPTKKKGSKRSPVSSSHNSKLHKQRTWELKRKLATERLFALTDEKLNVKEEPVNIDMRIICYPSEEKAKATNGPPNSDNVSTSAMERAQEIQENLSRISPSFVKNMLKSHVTGGFWLGLPKHFCVAHLPKHDERVILVGENGEEHATKYLVEKIGLSGGWRGFSIAHKLVEGDVLVFELIEPCKFKVHIVRASPLPEVNAARSLLNLHAEPMETVMMDEDEQDENTEITETSAPIHQQLAVADYNNTKDTKKLISIDGDSNNTDDFVPEILHGIRFSESPLCFKDVKLFNDFKIQVDGLIIDSEIPTHLRQKYYELCRSQNTFLHENLMKGLNTQLAAGMISETINIADAIRASKPSADPNNLEVWDKTLNAFEGLGMGVGFLRARIKRLVNHCRESRAVIESKRNEMSAAKDEMRALRTRLSDVEMLIKKLDEEIDGLKVKNEDLGFVFMDVAGAPW